MNHSRSQSPQEKLNRHARDCALQSVSRAINLAAPTVSYHAKGPLLLLGPEHRIRLAVERIAGRVACTALITEAMPEQIDALMERAAAIATDVALVKLPLHSLEGYLGRFTVQVSVADGVANLAQIEQRCDYFAAIVDLGEQPINTAQLKPAGYYTATTLEDLTRVVDEAVAMQGEFEKPRYFTINNDLCAHSSAKLDGCTRCLDVCPADAIRSHQQRIEIDAHLCHGAGGCASACPTGAIRYGYPQPQQTLDACRRLLGSYHAAEGEAPRLLIHDASFGQQWYQQQLNNDQLDSRWVGLEIEELGAAGSDLWLSALAWGAADVALLLPPDLPESIHSVLVQELRISGRLLKGLGLANQVCLLDPEALLSWSSDARPVEASLALVAGADKRQQQSRALEHLYNQSALGMGDASWVELPSGSPFGQLLLKQESCSLCMACVSVCPTQALAAGGDAPRLAFTSEACVQCGLCAKACPEDALGLLPGYQLNPQLRQQRQVLKEEEPFCCERCGKPFATQGAIALMLERLAGHSMFAGAALERLKMCGDCRVADLIINDPGADLFEYAKGREAGVQEVNLAPTPVSVSKGQGKAITNTVQIQEVKS